MMKQLQIFNPEIQVFFIIITLVSIMKAFSQLLANKISQPDLNLLIERVSQQQNLLLEQHIQKVKKFVEFHKGKDVMLLSSGGTSVSLEKNTVRMVENFSTGSRGSLLAEEILEQGYPLIFFYRDNSFLPYFSGITATSLALSQDQNPAQTFIKARQKLQKNKQNLLLLPFKTIYFYLAGILLLKQLLPHKSIIILCAAVSDFIPEQISQHKIQTQDKLQVKFQNSPKILGNLVDKRHVTISFKLETEKEKLNGRILWAIEKYGVDMVVGNLLGQKKWVKIVYNGALVEKGSDGVVEYCEDIQRMIVLNAISCQKMKFGNK